MGQSRLALLLGTQGRAAPHTLRVHPFPAGRTTPGRSGGFDLYTIKGEIVVDRVCRYENLQEEMDFLAEALHLPERPRLPNAKSQYRQDRRHYRELLRQQDVQAIASAFSREIEHFDYAP